MGLVGSPTRNLGCSRQSPVCWWRWVSSVLTRKLTAGGSHVNQSVISWECVQHFSTQLCEVIRSRLYQPRGQPFPHMEMRGLGRKV